MSTPARNANLPLYFALRLGMLVLLGVPSLSAQNSSIFNGPRDYLVGSYPESVVAGDFNGDGRPDIATANQASNNVSILLQNSDGTFHAAVNYPVGNGPMSLQTADVNQDGKLDLLLINVPDNTIGVLLGNGDGTFQTQKLTTISGGTLSCQSVGDCLAVGDFNGDGKLDVAIGVPLAQVATYAVAIFLGKGDGTFQAPVDYSINGQPYALASADFNNDGKLDLAVAVPGNGVSLLLGNGNGTFQAALNTPVPGGLTGLVVADFNGDGNLDIVTSSNQGGLVRLLGSGNGNFQIQLLGGSDTPLAAGDLDGDGKPDLACTGGIGIEILMNNGDGTFTSGQTLSQAGVDFTPAAVLSDLNNDQKLDLVVAQSNTNFSLTSLSDIVTVVNGNGDGTFATLPAYAGIRGFTPRGYATFGSLAAADFNGDGKIDLDVGLEFWLQATLQQGPGEGLYLNNGAGFSAPTATQLTIGSNDAAYAIAGDFNGDGRMDLAIASSSGSGDGVAVLLGNGDGTFQPEHDYGAGMNGPIAVGDFNNDGKLDLIGANAVLLGSGDGTFGFPLTFSVVSQGTLTGLAVADFNHDGKLDVAALAVANNSPVFAILAGNGDGTFTVGPTLNAGSNPTAVATGDLNGDGKPDLVVGDSGANGQAPNVVVLLGVGDGTFQNPVTTVAGNRISAVAVSDLDFDGKADVVISNKGWGDVALLLGNGDGTLQVPMQFYLNNFSTGAVSVADFNGDGKPDIAVAGFSSISVLLSGSGPRGPAALLSPPTLGFGNENVGYSSAAQTALLSNSGSSNLDISGITISGPQSGDYQQTNFCGASLAPAANCLINIVFSPLSAGVRTAVLEVTDNAAHSPQTINLSGTAGLFTVSVAPASLTFASQYTGSTSASQAVILTNTGNELLVINSIGVAGANASDFLQTNNCGSPIGGFPLALAVGDNCQVNVSFAPTEGGTRAAALTFINNASNSPQTVALSGTAQDFSVTVVSPSQTVSAGHAATYNLTVNPGGGFNQMVGMSCTGAPAQSTCSVSPSSFTLNGSASQPVTVTVTTTGSSAGLTRPPSGPALASAYVLSLSWFGILGLVSSLGLAGRRRPWRRGWLRALASVCLFGIGMTICACGGGSSGGGGSNRGTQAGSYNLTVTGNFTSGSTTLAHATHLTLVVQ